MIEHSGKKCKDLIEKGKHAQTDSNITDILRKQNQQGVLIKVNNDIKEILRGII